MRFDGGKQDGVKRFALFLKDSKWTWTHMPASTCRSWNLQLNLSHLSRSLQWSGNPYGNGYGVEMEWKWGTICENRMDWIGFGAECRLKTI